MSAQRSQSVRNRSQSFAEGRTCRRVHRVQNRREAQNCRHFLRFALQKCQQSQGSGGSWSRNPELSSLLDSSRVFASQKCQQSQGSGGSCSRSPELSSLLDSSRVFASQKCQQSQGSGGCMYVTRVCIRVRGSYLVSFFGYLVKLGVRDWIWLMGRDPPSIAGIRATSPHI